jgi:hypothetical protein
VCDLVHAFNGHHGQIVAAYTFDAGPNAVIFVPKSHHATLVTFMLYFFPLPESCSMENYSNRPGVLEEAATVIANGGMPEGLLEAGSATGRRPRAGDVKMMYCTKIGPGPQHIKDASECLIDIITGLPLTVAVEGNTVGGYVRSTKALGGVPNCSISKQIEEVQGAINANHQQLLTAIKSLCPSPIAMPFKLSVSFFAFYGLFGALGRETWMRWGSWPFLK